MRIVARAPAKLVLFGEYAVLAGAPAIVAAVDRCASVTLSPSTDGAWTASTDLDAGRRATLHWTQDRRLSAAEPAARTWTRAIAVVFESVIARAEVDPARLPGLDVHVATAPLYMQAEGQKLGLGSSAAVVTALAAAARYWLQACGAAAQPLDARSAFEQDLAAHRRLQGGGSGVDVAASTHGGLLLYTRGDGGSATVARLAWPGALLFRCVWTGVAASTSDLVAQVDRFRRERAGPYEEAMARLGKLARRAQDAFHKANADEIVALAADYHRAMDELGQAAGAPIVSEAHRALADLARREGTTYKPSGAGGGDVGLLFGVSLDALTRAARKAADHGFRVLDLRIQDDGVTVGHS